MKNSAFDQLIKDMGLCIKCKSLKNKNGRDQSLLNIYEDENFCKNIPSIWTDWYNRLDANIFVIGQDWGPLIEMKKFYEMYELDSSEVSWKRIIEEEKSLTKRMFQKLLVESAKNQSIFIEPEYIDQIYFTNAIMCARKGTNYRGEDINLKLSSLFCGEFLRRQIEIVEPKVILTLGYYPLYSISKIFNLEIEKNLSDTIEKCGEICAHGYVIIPLYHPSAQISKERQLRQYEKIWKYIK